MTAAVPATDALAPFLAGAVERDLKGIPLALTQGD